MADAMEDGRVRGGVVVAHVARRGGYGRVEGARRRCIFSYLVYSMFVTVPRPGELQFLRCLVAILPTRRVILPTSAGRGGRQAVARSRWLLSLLTTRTRACARRTWWRPPVASSALRAVLD